MTGGTLPYTFGGDGEQLDDWELHGASDSLKGTSYDTAHDGWTINITNGSITSNGYSAVTPYYAIPDNVGFFCVRFDASSVQSWDYINLCIYRRSGSNYTFIRHIYPIKTITSANGYITKIFYCHDASDIVCRFVVPVEIINDITKFDIYTGVGEVPKAQWFTRQRDDGQGGTFNYCRIEAQIPTNGGNYTLAFKSYRSLKNHLYYWHIDEQGNKVRIQDTPVTITDNPENLTLPSGCNFIVCVMEDTAIWNRPILAEEVYDIRVWKTNDIEFGISLELTDGINTRNYDISLTRPLYTGDILSYSKQKRINTDGIEESIILPAITSFSGTNTMSSAAEVTPSFYIITSTGAFTNAVNLAYVSIPESVKYIGTNAFRNTALTKVKIASDCTYFPNSFPDGCTVEFYSTGNS